MILQISFYNFSVTHQHIQKIIIQIQNCKPFKFLVIQKMALKKHEADGFRTLSFLFGFMYQFPAKWNANYTKMVYAKSSSILFPYFVVCSILLINGIVSLYYAFKYTFLLTSPNIPIFNKITLLMAGCISVSFIILITFNDFKNVVDFINFVLNVTAQLITGKI